MNLTEHFTLEELTRSDYAENRGLNNYPTDDVILANLYVLAEGLERVRKVLNKPITVSSGYRSPKVNSGVGGSKNSAHMKGLAADIIVPGIDPRKVSEILAENKDEILFDQLIHERTWTHIAFAEESPRLQVMTAVFNGKIMEYVKGIV